VIAKPPFVGTWRSKVYGLASAIRWGSSVSAHKKIYGQTPSV